MPTPTLEKQPSEQTSSDLHEIVYKAVYDALSAASFDLQFALQRRASEETVEFIRENLPLHLGFRSRLALLDRVLEMVPVEGLVLEFGVYRGRSINFIASRMPNRTIYGFDSFEGLPEPWLYRSRAFHDLEGLPTVRDNCVLVKGWFDETLAPFLEQTSGPCALIHIDSDIYSSAKLVLDQLEPRIGDGTMILFDDFFNYPGWKEGEYRAFNEFVERTGVKFEYVGFTFKPVPTEQRLREGSSPFQVAMRILSAPAPRGGATG
ncbi:MAG: TylF/MycF/NovP-related O-methyltransferase [Planctomycetota bacterium]|jgi:predicted O-methyltransferase YrrM